MSASFDRHENGPVRVPRWFGGMWVVLVCCLACSFGCTPAQGGSSEAEPTPTEQRDGSQTEVGSGQDAGSEGVDTNAYVPEGEVVEEWDEECLDRNGNVTAYAVSELSGWQLETLLLEQDYVWSGQDLTWLMQDGSGAVLVRGAADAILSDAQIAELGQGCTESVSYRIVSSSYPSTRRTFTALVAEVMVVEDVEFGEDGVVAVAYGPSMRRMLVLVTESNDVIVLSLFSEPSLAAGVLEEVVGQQLGTTVDAAFESLTGRLPGATDDE